MADGPAEAAGPLVVVGAALGPGRWFADRLTDGARPTVLVDTPAAAGALRDRDDGTTLVAVLEEDGGSVGTVCIYQASSPEKIREHANRADLPADEIIKVADTVIVRPDPEAATA